MKPAAGVNIAGMEDLQETLKEALPREATNILRRTTFGLAGVVTEKIKERAPRRTGKFRKSIKRKRNRGTKTEISSSVVAESGKKSRGFLWHFFEFGTVKMSARPFIVPTVEAIRPNVPSIYREEFGVQYEREMAKRNKKRK